MKQDFWPSPNIKMRKKWNQSRGGQKLNQIYCLRSLVIGCRNHCLSKNCCCQVFKWANFSLHKTFFYFLIYKFSNLFWSNILSIIKFTFSAYLLKTKFLQTPTQVPKQFQILKIYCRKNHACKHSRHFVIRNGSRFVFVFFGLKKKEA